MNFVLPWKDEKPQSKKKTQYQRLHPLIRQKYQSVADSTNRQLCQDARHLNLSCESIKSPGPRGQPLKVPSIPNPTHPNNSKKLLSQDLINSCKMFWLTNARIRKMHNKQSAILIQPTNQGNNPNSSTRYDRLRINTIKRKSRVKQVINKPTLNVVEVVEESIVNEKVKEFMETKIEEEDDRMVRYYKAKYQEDSQRNYYEEVEEPRSRSQMSLVHKKYKEIDLPVLKKSRTRLEPW